MSKTTTRVRVAIGEKASPVGELVFETDGRRDTSMFRYDVAWLEHPDRFAVAPSMPLSDSPFYCAATPDNRRGALPGAVADSTPDSWGRGLIRKASNRPLTELDFLLAANDQTRQGALRYIDSDGQPMALSSPAIPRLAELRQVRRLAGTALEALPHAERDRLVGSAGSLGGARPKASVVDDDGSLMIAKFTSDDDTMPIERVEVVTLKLARAAGLNAAVARLELGNTRRPVALIRRFDRRDGDRVGYLSAQSFIGADHATGAYYTDIADVLRAYASDVKADLAELYRRILFTILVSNNDDHLKNHGLLHVAGGQWALSPAFDINPQPHRHRHLETGISELSGNEASIEAALEAAPFFEIDRDTARVALRDMIELVDGRWQIECRKVGMTRGETKAYTRAFDHEETRIGRRLAQL
ncbi:MAG: type II toxin-antitoxin system HipA family toxin [Gammaproteobacteria bacterium]|nr:type II toxin-antitoxin system HipA family toxin [Gammaproteobacteria bacterium]